MKEKLKKQIQETINKAKTAQSKYYLATLSELKNYFQWEEGTIVQQEALASKKKELNEAIELLTQKYLLKNNWSETALLIVDTQEVYREQVDKMKIIPQLKKIIEVCYANEMPIIWTQHGHEKNDDGGQLGKWWGEKDLVIHGTPGWEIIKEISPNADKGEPIIIPKKYYSAFHKTKLLETLKSLGVKTVVIGGTLTNLCCEDTAKGAFSYEFEVVFLKDGNAASTKEMHNSTLSNLDYGYAITVTVDQVIKGIGEQNIKNLVEKPPKAKL